MITQPPDVQQDRHTKKGLRTWDSNLKEEWVKITTSRVERLYEELLRAVVSAIWRVGGVDGGVLLNTNLEGFQIFVHA